MKWNAPLGSALAAALLGALASCSQTAATPQEATHAPTARSDAAAAAASRAAASNAAAHPTAADSAGADTADAGGARRHTPDGHLRGVLQQHEAPHRQARLRWTVATPALAELTARTTTRQSVEVTVYKDGFAKGLSATLPLGAASAERPIAAVVPATRPALRAYQLQIIEVERPRALESAAGGGSETGVIVEGLEPGMNYTWRVAVETPDGNVVSAPVTCQALVCPADMVQGEAPPARRP